MELNQKRARENVSAARRRLDMRMQGNVGAY